MKKILLTFLFLGMATQTAWAQLSADYALGGAVIIGAANDSCNAAQSQALRWSSSNNTIEMCDGGGAWRQIIATTGSDMPAAPSQDIGYFVISHNVYDGDLNGISGANNICLSELTTYDWRGKADAQSRNLLNSNHVKAWLCTGSNCQNLNAWQIYQFAAANDPDKGGATISVESDSLTHNNMQNWSGQNYWGHASYYTGRDTGTATAFGETQYGPCQGWEYNGPTSSIYGAIGSTYYNDTRRWYNYSGGTCPEKYRIACIVHP